MPVVHSIAFLIPLVVSGGDNGLKAIVPIILVPICFSMTYDNTYEPNVTNKITSKNKSP